MKKILFLTPYPVNRSPSQRFRLELFFPILKQHGYDIRISSFLTNENWTVFYQKGRIVPKLIALIRGTFTRLCDVPAALNYDLVFIHREALPLGPPMIEWLLTVVFRKRVIYDFDDAIWLTDRQESWFARVLKWRHKTQQICTWAYNVSCGNAYLYDFASQFNSRVFLVPSVVDTESHHNPNLFSALKRPDMITVGWTGSHTTLKYLADVADVLFELRSENKFLNIVIISNQKPDTPPLSTFNFIEWNSKTEIEDLICFDVGIMPLPDDPWTRGKCGFKIIQYMALGIPAVASPVGVNKNIINHGVDGFLASSKEEWKRYISQLTRDESLRKLMGRRGRLKIVDHYSVKSSTRSFLSLFG